MRLRPQLLTIFQNFLALIASTCTRISAISVLVTARASVCLMPGDVTESMIAMT
jgi:hypothetical protein